MFRPIPERLNSLQGLHYIRDRSGSSLVPRMGKICHRFRCPSWLQPRRQEGPEKRAIPAMVSCRASEQRLRGHVRLQDHEMTEGRDSQPLYVKRMTTANPETFEASLNVENAVPIIRKLQGIRIRWVVRERWKRHTMR